MSQQKQLLNSAQRPSGPRTQQLWNLFQSYCYKFIFNEEPGFIRFVDKRDSLVIVKTNLKIQFILKLNSNS